jgi:hypothetical protein
MLLLPPEYVEIEREKFVAAGNIDGQTFAFGYDARSISIVLVFLS